MVDRKSKSAPADCFSCFRWLSAQPPSTYARADRSPDTSPQSWGLPPDIDEVPSKERPRVGSWASPVPSFAAPWGTWQMPEPKLQVLPQALDIKLSISEETPGHYVSKAVATAQPHRLQEIGWRQAGARYSPQPGFMLEQILASPGRLPPHESRSDRAVADVEKALADLPKYATTNERIAKCPRRLLTERGLAGQQLRRGILKGSTIAFITTGYEGKRFIYEKACELGVRSVLVDSADSWSRQLVDEGIAVKFLAIDMSQSSDRLLEFLIEAIRNLEKDPKIGKVDAVATFAELSVPLTARLAEALGVPGPAPESTDQARDKFLTRQALARNGLPTPPVYEILSEQDIDPAIRTVGFPAVLKPVSGAASVGVKKVENEAELWSAYSVLTYQIGYRLKQSGRCEGPSALHCVESDEPSEGLNVKSEEFLGLPVESRQCLPALQDSVEDGVLGGFQLHSDVFLAKADAQLFRQDVADEVQQAASELLDWLDRGAATSAERLSTEHGLLGVRPLTLEVSGSEEMRRWFAGHAPRGLTDDLSSQLCPRRLQCTLRSCKKQEKVKSPIANTLYPGSQLLAKLVLSCPELVADKRVLEIGAGYHGIPSMAAVLAEAHTVVATDVDPAALHQLRLNLADVMKGRGIDAKDFDDFESLALDGLGPKVSVLRLDWCALPTSAPSFQVVLASEIIHELWMGQAVLDAVSRFLEPGGFAIIVNAASYHRFGAEEFQQLLLATQYNVPEKQTTLPGGFSSRRFQVSCEAIGGVDTEDLAYDCYVLQIGSAQTSCGRDVVLGCWNFGHNQDASRNLWYAPSTAKSHRLLLPAPTKATNFSSFLVDVSDQTSTQVLVCDTGKIVVDALESSAKRRRGGHSMTQSSAYRAGFEPSLFRAAVGASAVIGARFVLESYLDGEEVDVDVVMSDGEWQYAAVSDNGPTLEPYFNETWAVSPSLLPRDRQLALRELAVSSVKALGFQDGIFHVELKYTSQHGAQLIEVNARMGGGPVYSTNLKTWGVDLVEETLFCAAGIPSRPVATRKPVECIANADVNALRSGRLVDLSFMKPLLQREGVVSHNCHVREGEEVVGPQDGLPTWLVEVVVSRPTPREALDFLMKLEAEIQALVKLA
ncbi:CARNS1 [Symbiodinium sp. CCMP2592]|nr:CARNS1 [Symbiodinium sp. CCMP2592]